MTQYRAGRDVEYKVRDALIGDGYEVIRAAGSKGKIDLVAFKQFAMAPHWFTGHMLFVQVKRTDGTIPPDDRAELLRLAHIAGALPIVAHREKVGRRVEVRYRQLTGPGAKQWQPWTPDEVGRPV